MNEPEWNRDVHDEDLLTLDEINAGITRIESMPRSPEHEKCPACNTNGRHDRLIENIIYWLSDKQWSCSHGVLMQNNNYVRVEQERDALKASIHQQIIELEAKLAKADAEKWALAERAWNDGRYGHVRQNGFVEFRASIDSEKDGV